MAGMKLGRTHVLSGSALPHTGSAFAALDALGNPFPIANVAPNRGALVAHAVLMESGSASAQIRAHFYTNQPSAIITGGQAIIQPASGYLGYIDFVTWVSAHGSAGMSQASTPNLALRGDEQSRVWCQLQAVTTPTFNNDTVSLLLYLGVVQD